MRVTPDRLDVAEAALEAYAEHLMQYGRAALPPRNDLRRVIEALPERSDAMSDPIKAYARAVAEATRKYLYVTQTADVPMLDEHDLQAIIATVPAPVMQHHAAPTCVGWWWARRKGKWEAVRVTGWGAGSQDRHVAMVERAGTFTGAVCDAWVGPLLPPDTTEPAPVATPKWCNVHQHHKWCEHNGGVMGPTGYAAPDVQAQIDAAVKEVQWAERIDAREELNAAVAREREECARVAEWVWDSGNHGAHGGEQANRTTAAIRARSAKGA